MPRFVIYLCMPSAMIGKTKAVGHRRPPQKPEERHARPWRLACKSRVWIKVERARGSSPVAHAAPRMNPSNARSAKLPLGRAFHKERRCARGSIHGSPTHLPPLFPSSTSAGGRVSYLSPRAGSTFNHTRIIPPQKKTAAEKVLGNAERTAKLRNNRRSASISLRPQISREFPSHPRVELPIHPSSFVFHPRSPQTPSLPTPSPVLAIPGAACAKANS